MSLPLATSDRIGQHGLPDAVNAPACNAPSSSLPGPRLGASRRHHPTRSCAACPGCSGGTKTTHGMGIV